MDEQTDIESSAGGGNAEVAVSIVLEATARRLLDVGKKTPEIGYLVTSVKVTSEITIIK